MDLQKKKVKEELTGKVDELRRNRWAVKRWTQKMTNSVTKMDSRVVEEDAVAADEATDEEEKLTEKKGWTYSTSRRRRTEISEPGRYLVLKFYNYLRLSDL